MKTIFIPIFSGNEGKYIFRSDIYKVLMGRRDVRLVVFLKSQERADYYRKEFSDSRLQFEVMPPLSLSWLDRFLGALKYYLLRSKTIDLKRWRRYQEEGNILRFLASFILNRLLAHRWFRKLVRSADKYFNRNAVLAAYFEKYKPDLVLLPDVFDDLESAFTNEARRRNIPSIGIILSWDRATSRWMIRALPDKVIVHNDIMKEEMVEFTDTASGNILISGTVQHDHLVNDLIASREEFLKKYNIPSDHKIIVYGPIGRTFDKTKELDRGVVEMLDEAIDKKLFGDHKISLIVRFPPNDFVDEKDLKQYKHVIYQVPGFRFTGQRGQDWDMSFDDLQLLRDTVKNSSLMVTYYSSFSIDGAIYDRPVINIDFDIKNGQVAEKRHIYYQTTHYGKVIPTGGIRLVKNKEDLFNWVKNYLDNPALDKEGRKKLVETQCWKVDGRSAERAANFVLEQLK